MILTKIQEEYSRIINLNKFEQVTEYVKSKGYNPLSENLAEEQLQELLEFCKTIN